MARDYIFQLPEKLEFLAKLTDNGTFAELWQFVNKSSLEQACNPKREDIFSRLGRGHQRSLAEAFGFEIEWEEWRDSLRDDENPEGRIDTAAAFKRALLKARKQSKSNGRETKSAGSIALNSSSDKGSKGQAAESEAAAPVSGARQVVAEVVAGRRSVATTPLGTMARVGLELGQAAGHGAHQFLVEVSCHAANIEGSRRRFSVRHALLAIDPKHARGRRDAIAGITGSPLILQNPNGETATFAWCGSLRLLRWEVSAGGVAIGYLWFDAGVIEELAHGDILRVSLSAWIKHIDVVDDETEPVFGISDAKGNLLDQGSEAMTVEQQRLIEHLNKLTLPSDGNGYAEVASEELEVVRKQ